MQSLSDLSKQQFNTLITGLGEKSFRKGQLYRAVMQYKSYGEMTDIPKPLREKLATLYIDKATQIIETLTSKDGTEKYLFKMADGNIVEGVLMKYKYGNTQCISTQVGCQQHR